MTRSRTRFTRRMVLAAVLPAAIAAAALPAAADAATASISGTAPNRTLTYQAASGERNDLRVSVATNQIVFDDQVVITAGSGCSLDGAGNARCSVDVASVSVALGGHGDTVRYQVPHAGTVTGADGDDRFIAGQRQAAGHVIAAVSYFGGAGSDEVYYGSSTGPIDARIDNLALDGRRSNGVSVDLENVRTDIEELTGSSQADVLHGSGNGDVLNGGLGDDQLFGNGGADVFAMSDIAADGADRYSGGAAGDRVRYSNGGRPNGVRVTLDNVANDGASGELDDVRSDVEEVEGTDAADVLRGNAGDNALFGHQGDDLLEGGAGNDSLFGGGNLDTVRGEAGNDFLDTIDHLRDNVVDCGADVDTADRDDLEGSVIGCEGGQVGELELSPQKSAVAAGAVARLRLSWRHPVAWRKLDGVVLKLTRQGATVGEVVVKPRGERLAARAGVRLQRRASRLVRRGNTVTAHLALRLDPALAGQALRAEVEATEVGGRRQLERRAATLRVAH